MQTTIIIEDSSSSPDFIDDNPVVSAEISSGNIEPRADSAIHGSVPSEDAHIVSIGHHKIFPVWRNVCTGGSVFTDSISYSSILVADAGLAGINDDDII